MGDDMKQYIGVKSIKARPMNRGDYNKYRGWQIPADENPEDEGFLVEYPDGYISWSPKKQFEDAYVELISPNKFTADNLHSPKCDYTAGDDNKSDKPFSIRLYANDGGFIRASDELAYNNYHQFVVESGNDAHTNLGVINFQKGPIREVGVNGITEMDLLNILAFRYEMFQKSAFASDYNAKTLKGIKLALAAQRLRNYDRERRGVEGTSKK